MSDSPKMILSPNNEFKDNSDDSGAQSSVAIQNKLVQPRSLEEDQDQLNSKQCRLEYFRNGVDADCEVHVPRNGDNGSKALENVCYKKFRCHRVFLATASEKLEHDVLLNNQWNGILQISGVSPESVEIFLEFIYTFEVTSTIINLKIIGDIFVLSCAYQLPELLSIFSQKLKDIEFPLEDIFPTYDLAFRNSMLDLENACLEKIIINAAELKSQPNLTGLQLYAFNYVIQLWLATQALSETELILLLKQYQLANELNFQNSMQFPHFTKILRYFPQILLNGEGIIHTTES